MSISAIKEQAGDVETLTQPAGLFTSGTAEGRCRARAAFFYDQFCLPELPVWMASGWFTNPRGRDYTRRLEISWPNIVVAVAILTC